MLWLSSGSSGYIKRYARGYTGDKEMWCSGGAQGKGLLVLEMYLMSGCVPAVLSGAMISMGRTLEKLGPKR